MGLADLFVKLGIAYDSEEGVELGRRVQQFVDDEAKRESERLAEVRGVFPEWERSIWGPDETCARTPSGERIRPMRRLRNCNVTTVAPTGTISIIAGCSSGIEPLFAVAFMRNQAGVLMPDVNEDFVAIARQEGWYSEDLMRRIAEAGHIDFPEVPAKWQRVFVTANHIKPEWHIRMQAAFQEYNDSAISKTCNFANDATEEYVEEIYRLAYRLELQGRDGLSRRQPGHAGALDRLDRQEGAGAGDRHRAGRGAGRPGGGDYRRGAPSSAVSSPSSRPRTAGCGGWCTISRPRTCSAGRSGRARSCSAGPRGGWRRRSGRSTSPSPRTIAVSRSKSS